MRWFFLLMAYLLPLVVAYAMGREIGDAYGGSFNWSDGWSLGTHTVAMAGEFALAMMTLSAATALRRMTQDSSYALNEAELEIERAQSSAARRQTEERQDLKMKEQRNQVWLELDRLHAQSMITHAKQQAALPPATTSITPQTDATAVNEVKIRRIERTS